MQHRILTLFRGAVSELLTACGMILAGLAITAILGLV